MTSAPRPAPLPGREFLVIIYAKEKAALGSQHALGAGPVRIGRMSDNEIVLDEDAVSRRHARLERRGDGWAVMDVGSRNGTVVNGREITSTVRLANGDRLQIGSTIFKLFAGDDTEGALYEEIYQLTITDNLTQVSNRRHFDEVLERECSRARRFGRPLSLLMLDIDLFKQVNDRDGHLVGDAVLREVAQLIRKRVRGEDTVARYGGEEFAVIMPETTGTNARLVAESIRSAIAVHVVVWRSARVSVTASIGCAERLDGDADASDLVMRADARLYAAKDAGRDTVL